MRVLADEYDIVSQMQVIDREVFFYLCNRTDNETGVIGRRVRVSRAGVALDISERMEPGKRSACWVVSSGDVKHAIERLVNAGLLTRLSKAEKGADLVLSRVFLVAYLAKRQSVQKQVARPTARRLPDLEQENNNKNSALDENNALACPEVARQVARTINNNINNNAREGNRFAMSIDWQPTETELRAMLFRSGGSKYRFEDIKPEWLGNFVGYWFARPGRQCTQAQWTAMLSTYLINFGLFEQSSPGQANSKQRPVDAGNKHLPDWARLPRIDDQLVGWARQYGFGEADSGDGFMEFRRKLQMKINKRLTENNLAKVVW